MFSDKNIRGLEFDVLGGDPVLPLKAHGELWSTGWDIPTRWAVDASGQAWMDNAHGHPLHRVGAKDLLADCEDDGEWENIAKILNVPFSHCKVCGRLRKLDAAKFPCGCNTSRTLKELLARAKVAEECHSIPGAYIVLKMGIEDLIKE